MKKKVLVRGPFLTRSGYGEHTRMILRMLKNKDEIELFAIPTSWGQTGWLKCNYPDIDWMNELAEKTSRHIATNGGFDASIQVTIPVEFQMLAPVNVGVTAGIETHRVSPAWNDRVASMNALVVPSRHSKSGFDKELHNKIGVIPFPFRNEEKQDLDLSFVTTSFNFLAVAQDGPRKNLIMTITEFINEFQDDEKVGLILKADIKNGSYVDYTYFKEKYIPYLNSKFPNGYKCRVYLLHGDLEDSQMASLYSSEKVNALVSTTHGEGFGLPIFSSVVNNKPVIAPDWSGHLDFLYKDKEPLFGKISYSLKPIQQEAVWPGVIDPGMMWCFPNSASYREKLRNCYNYYGSYRSNAEKLGEYIRNEFAEEKVNSDMWNFLKPFLVWAEQEDEIFRVAPLTSEQK